MIQTWSQWYQLVCSTELFHSWNASCLPNLVANVSHSRKTSLHHLTPGSRAVRAQQHKARCWSPWQRYIFISHTKALLTHVGSAFAEQALKYGLKRHCRAVVSWWLDASHPIAMVSHQKQWLSVTRGTLQTDRCVAGAGGNIRSSPASALMETCSRAVLSCSKTTSVKLLRRGRECPDSMQQTQRTELWAATVTASTVRLGIHHCLCGMC